MSSLFSPENEDKTAPVRLNQVVSSRAEAIHRPWKGVLVSKNNSAECIRNYVVVSAYYTWNSLEQKSFYGVNWASRRLVNRDWITAVLPRPRLELHNCDLLDYTNIFCSPHIWKWEKIVLSIQVNIFILYYHFKTVGLIIWHLFCSGITVQFWYHSLGEHIF